jgi:hypothetical protein
LTAGWRHQRSRRSVDSLICARVLFGATGVCVILDVSAFEHQWGHQGSSRGFR